MFENRYDIAYKLLIAVFILMALYSIIDPAAAPRVFNVNETHV